MKMLDIITVCYNDLPNLKLTADSLIQQSTSEFHWLVVDGGSTDGTRAFIESLNLKFPITFVSAKDKGIYDAMNKGVRISTSDYVWFLNAGDKAFDANSVKLIIDNFQKSADLHIYPVVYPRKDMLIKSDTQLTGKRKTFNTPVCHQGIIYRRSLFKKYGFYDLNFKLAADFEHLSRLQRFKVNILSYSESICSYKGGGASETRPGELYKEILLINLKYLPGFLKALSVILFSYRYFRYVLLAKN